VPIDKLKLPKVKPGNYVYPPTKDEVYYTWVDKAPATIEVKVTGGLIAHYRDRGNVKIYLYAAKNPMDNPVATNDSVPPDGKVHKITLKTPFNGLHWIEVNDRGDSTRITLPENMPMTLPAGIEKCSHLSYYWNLYFYVPKGTAKVAGYSTDNRHGSIKDGDGKVI